MSTLLLRSQRWFNVKKVSNPSPVKHGGWKVALKSATFQPIVKIPTKTS